MCIVMGIEQNQESGNKNQEKRAKSGKDKFPSTYEEIVDSTKSNRRFDEVKSKIQRS